MNNEPKLKVFVRGGGSPPAYANPGDSGLDLRSPVDIELQPGETVKIDTGVHVSIPYGRGSGQTSQLIQCQGCPRAAWHD